MLQCRLLAAESLGTVSGASGTFRQLLGLSLRPPLPGCPPAPLARPHPLPLAPAPPAHANCPRLRRRQEREHSRSFFLAARRGEDSPTLPSPVAAPPPSPGQPRRFMSGSDAAKGAPLTGSLAGAPSRRPLTSAVASAATGPKDVVGMTWPSTAIVPQVRGGQTRGAPLGYPPCVLVVSPGAPWLCQGLTQGFSAESPGPGLACPA